MPWLLLNEDAGEKLSQAAWMHRNRGLGFTKGLIWRAPHSYPDYSASPTPYLHAPPLLGLTLLGSTQLFGESPATLRGTMVFIMVLTSWVFYWFCIRVGLTPSWAALAYAFFSLNPMSLYYGRNVFYESLGLLFSLLGLAVMLPARSAPGKKACSMFPSLMTGLLGGMSNFFPILPFGLLLAGGSFSPSFRPYRKNALAFILGFLIAMLLLAFLGAWAVGTSAFIQDFMDALARRTSNTSEGGEVFTWSMWAIRALHWTTREFSPVLLGGSIAGATWMLVRRLKGKTSSVSAHFFALLALSGLLYVAFLRSGSWVHRYFYLFLLPGLAGMSALFVRSLSHAVRRVRLHPAWIVMPALAFLWLFTQPTLAIRFERDGRYPTSNPLIHPPGLAEWTSQFWGSQRPSPAIAWHFPPGLPEKERQVCLFWPDTAGCEAFAVPAAPSPTSASKNPH